jgi:hypothetical protein
MVVGNSIVCSGSSIVVGSSAISYYGGNNNIIIADNELINVNHTKGFLCGISFSHDASNITISNNNILNFDYVIPYDPYGDTGDGCAIKLRGG